MSSKEQVFLNALKELMGEYCSCSNKGSEKSKTEETKKEISLEEIDKLSASGVERSLQDFGVDTKGMSVSKQRKKLKEIVKEMESQPKFREKQKVLVVFGKKEVDWSPKGGEYKGVIKSIEKVDGDLTGVIEFKVNGTKQTAELYLDDSIEILDEEGEEDLKKKDEEELEEEEIEDEEEEEETDEDDDDSEEDEDDDDDGDEEEEESDEDDDSEEDDDDDGDEDDDDDGDDDDFEEEETPKKKSVKKDVKKAIKKTKKIIKKQKTVKKAIKKPLKKSKKRR